MSDRLNRSGILVGNRIIDQDTFDQYKTDLSQEYQTVEDAPGGVISSSVSTPALDRERFTFSRRALTYNEFVSGDVLVSSAETRVDVASLDNTTLLEQTPIESSFRQYRVSATGKPALLPFKAIALQKGNETLLASELLSGEISDIGTVFVTAGRYYFPDRRDLINYLYMASSGLNEFVAKKVFIEN